MCLELFGNAKVEQSSTPITVYKYLIPLYSLKGKARSPYQGEYYRRGELKKVRQFSGPIYPWGKTGRFTKTLPSNVHSVYEGLHAYVSKNPSWRRSLGDGVMVECTIPKNTPFIKGKRGHIVTLKLKIGKAVRGSRWAKEKFNGE